MGRRQIAQSAPQVGASIIFARPRGGSTRRAPCPRPCSASRSGSSAPGWRDLARAPMPAFRSASGSGSTRRPRAASRVRGRAVAFDRNASTTPSGAAPPATRRKPARGLQIRDQAQQMHGIVRPPPRHGSGAPPITASRAGDAAATGLRASCSSPSSWSRRNRCLRSSRRGPPDAGPSGAWPRASARCRPPTHVAVVEDRAARRPEDPAVGHRQRLSQRAERKVGIRADSPGRERIVRVVLDEQPVRSRPRSAHPVPVPAPKKFTASTASPRPAPIVSQRGSSHRGRPRTSGRSRAVPSRLPPRGRRSPVATACAREAGRQPPPACLPSAYQTAGLGHGWNGGAFRPASGIRHRLPTSSRSRRSHQPALTANRIVEAYVVHLRVGLRRLRARIAPSGT